MVSEAFGGNSGDDNNSQDDKKLGQQPTGIAGPAPLAGSQQGRVASFSSGQPQSQGSGRFTNIQKYMDANKQASINLGSKANTQMNKAFGQQQQGVSEKNQALQSAFQKGEQDIQTGQGFQSQLGQIKQGLQTGFQDFGNRDVFDQAGQQAMDLAANQDYSRVASGQAIDDAALAQQQQQAVLASQGLLGSAQQNLRNIETEQGRDQLFSQVLQPKQGYTAGQRSFDKLFLGGALGNIKQNLQGQQTSANQLLQSTQGQQTTLDDLLKREAALTGDISKLARESQDVFDTQFGSQANIDYVNKLREERFKNLQSALQNKGQISQEDAEALGLTGLDSTFVNENQASADMGKTQVAPQQLYGTYNLLNDPAAVNKYITQGQQAMSAQDITTQSDFDRYKALQALALGRDTGKLSGISQLGSSVNVVGDLAGDIKKADEAFRQSYGNKSFTSAFGNYGDERRDQLYAAPFITDQGSLGTFGRQESVLKDTPLNLQDYLSEQKNKTNQNISNFLGGLNTLEGQSGVYSGDMSKINGVDLGATAVGQSNIANYLRGLGEEVASTGLYDQGKDFLGDFVKSQTERQVRQDLQNRMKDVVDSEGVRNALSLGENKNYKRFSGLV